MESGPPSLVTIVPDEFQIEHVGWTDDGRQFFLTEPFVPCGREFVALYLFDAEGQLVDARIDDLGPRAEVDQAAAEALVASRLAELGPREIGPIRVKPFQLERFGVTFGLVPAESEGYWWVNVEPGGYIGFIPPWDGSYDT